MVELTQWRELAAIVNGGHEIPSKPMTINDEILAGLQRDLHEMRKVYVQGPIRGRVNIAIMRLTDHHFGPNRLVTAVSAVDAIARSIVVHHTTKKKQQTMMKSYMEYKNHSPQDLVEEALKAHGQFPAEKVFGVREWKVFGYAVEFRHLLVHECTYLSLDKFQILIDSCGLVLQKLVEGTKVKLKTRDIRYVVNMAGLDGGARDPDSLTGLHC